MNTNILFSDEFILLSYLIEKGLIEQAEVIYVDGSQRKSADELNISITKINKMMKDLMSKQILKKSSKRGLYKLNPNYLDLYLKLKEVSEEYEQTTNNN